MLFENLMSAIASVDFTNYLCAYQNLDITVYPESVRMTVIRMREFTQSKVFFDGHIKLGSGTEGVVYKGHYVNIRGVKTVCAFKVFKNDDSILDEVEMLWKSAGVRSMVGLHGIFSYKPMTPGKGNALALDYVEGPTIRLSKAILEWSSPFEADTIELARQLFEFLVEIKTPTSTRKTGLMHLDLSGNNVFWNRRKLVIIDAGLMAEIGFLKDAVVQLETCRAPEIFLNQKSIDNMGNEQIRYTESVDVWSVGVLVHEYVTAKAFNFIQNTPIHGRTVVPQLIGRIGMPPASYLNTVVAADKFFNKKEDGTFVLKRELLNASKCRSLEETHRNCPNSSPLMLDLLKRILVWNPAERITAEQALTHPIFKK